MVERISGIDSHPNPAGPGPAEPGPIADLVLARPARLGSTRLVCVDGPAGSGKTTLAAALAAALAGRGVSVTVLHLDDLYDGWDGLPAVGAQVQQLVVEPLAAGRPGRYRRYDWHAGGYAEHRDVRPDEVVVIEGVGSAHRGYADRVTLLVWVEAPADDRLHRGLEREGPELEPQWRRWLATEQAVLDREGMRERVDVLVDGVTGQVTLR